MKVLVTGALGAIGSAVLHRLVADGHAAVAYDQRIDLELVDDIAGDVEVEQGDVRDWARLAQVLRGHDVEVVIHMAALLPDQCQREPKLGMEVNVGGTVAVCELARILGIRRVVFCSSKGVYRRIADEHGHPDYVPVDEDYPIGPDGVYDVTKYSAEQLGINYASSHGVDFVALRFAATYGPGRMARHGALAIRSAIVENAVFGRPTKLARGGDQLDDFVYTKDVAQALVKATSASGLEHRVFNIGTGQASSLSAAAEVIRRHVPGAEIEIGPGTDYGASGRYCIFDISRARRELGYEPEFDHAAGIADYLEVLERAG
ncbi:MAG: NAD-dependent epimerase/dehydratase family protein [Acidimicrobiales bacterium]